MILARVLVYRPVVLIIKNETIKTENNTGTIPYKRSLLCNFGLVKQRETSWNMFSQVLSPESTAFCPKKLKTSRNGGGAGLNPPPPPRPGRPPRTNCKTHKPLDKEGGGGPDPPPPLRARTPVRDNCKKRDSIM